MSGSARIIWRQAAWARPLCFGIGLTLAALATTTAMARTDSGGREPAYDRVMSTHTLRCAYAAYPPAFIIDPNTRQLSGIFHDLVETMAKLHGLTVAWTEEVDYGHIIEGLEQRRYDAFCAALWPGPERAQRAVFTVPVYYSAVNLYVRTDDHRFDADPGTLDDPRYRLAI